jgi:hypothetical protein
VQTHPIQTPDAERESEVDAGGGFVLVASGCIDSGGGIGSTGR